MRTFNDVICNSLIEAVFDEMIVEFFLKTNTTAQLLYDEDEKLFIVQGFGESLTTDNEMEIRTFVMDMMKLTEHFHIVSLEDMVDRDEKEEVEAEIKFLSHKLSEVPLGAYVELFDGMVHVSPFDENTYVLLFDDNGVSSGNYYHRGENHFRFPDPQTCASYIVMNIKHHPKVREFIAKRKLDDNLFGFDV